MLHGFYFKFKKNYDTNFLLFAIFIPLFITIMMINKQVKNAAEAIADLKDGQKLKTVQGNELTVSIKDGKVMIDGAVVTIADVVSSNGVTHVIDAVVTPKK
jgi:uncharacterized surface protein with fasciclin (FAS1) repeats